MDVQQSEIAEWYRGRSIFITGATGFMGKVLVEKLLRSCPDIGMIFLLIRKKEDGITSSGVDRVQEMLSYRLFDNLRAIHGNLRDKITAVPGNISLPNLGISVHDRDLLQKSISVVFHVAATVRFTEPLRRAFTMNVEGTKSVIQLCRGMKNLAAIVHVSTAYSNCTVPCIQERVYPPPLDVEQVEHCVAGLDDDTLEIITPRLIRGHPNTYTFTKAIAEHVVAGYSTELPIVVVRPSIVSASWKEPIPGWVDNLNGPTSLVVSAGTGLLNSIFGNEEFVVDFIPVDACINLFIAAAWEIGNRERMKPAEDVLVYNCVSRPFNPLTWAVFVEVIDKCTTNYTMRDYAMTPKLFMTNSRVRHNLANLKTQTYSYLLDFFSWMSGGKQRCLRYRSKVNKLAKTHEFFMTKQWDFDGENVKHLKDRLSHVDREIFDFDTSKINWKEYLASYFFGIRRYVMNENEETIKRSKKQISSTGITSKIVDLGLLGLCTVGVMNSYNLFDTIFNYFLTDRTLCNDTITYNEQYSMCEPM